MNLRRVFFISGITAAVSCAAASILRPETALICTAALFALAAILFIFLGKHPTLYRCFLPLIFFAVFIALAVFNYIYQIQPVKLLAGNSATVVGKVCDDPEYNNGFVKIPIKTESISLEGSAQKVRIALNVPVQDSYSYGDRVEADVSFTALSEIEKKLYYPDGIYIKAGGYSVAPLKNNGVNRFYQTALKIRSTVKARILTYYNDDVSGFLSGLTLGDRSAMADETYNNFINSGIVHLTAVSGLHLGVIAGLIYNLLKKLSRHIAGIITAASVIVIMAVTGFSPSIVRSGTMFIIMVIAESLSHKSDPLNSLGLAMTIMLVINPCIWMSAAFILTTASVIGIIVFNEPLSRIISYPLKRIYSKLLSLVGDESYCAGGLNHISVFIKRIVNLVSVTIAASVLVTPAVACIFGRVAVLTVPANLLAVTAGSLNLVLLIITLVIPNCFLLGAVRDFLIWLVSVIAKYIIAVSEIFGSSKISTLQLNSSTAVCLAAAAAASAGVVMIFAALGKRSTISSVTSIVLSVAVAATASSVLSSGGYAVIMPRINGYSCIVAKGSTAVMIGTGGDYSDTLAINKLLNDRGIKKLTAIVVPNSENCKSGADYFSAEYETPIYCDNDCAKNFKSEKIYSINNLNIKISENINICIADKQSETVSACIDNIRFLFIPRKCADAGFTKPNDIIFLSAGALSSEKISAEAFKILNSGNIDKNLRQKSEDDKTCCISDNEIIAEIDDKLNVRFAERRRISVF